MPAHIFKSIKFESSINDFGVSLLSNMDIEILVNII